MVPSYKQRREKHEPDPQPNNGSLDALRTTHNGQGC